MARVLARESSSLARRRISMRHSVTSTVKAMYTATAPKVTAAKRQSNLREQHRGDQRELEDHRDDREQQVGKQRRDAARAALDVARHAAGLAVEVEAQAEAVQVAEHAERDAPDRALRDAHEHHVAQLAEQRGREAQDAVDREQRHRHGDDRRLRCRGRPPPPS